MERVSREQLKRDYLKAREAVKKSDRDLAEYFGSINRRASVAYNHMNEKAARHEVY